uniref:PH domain-containing protein n=2 Tax=Anopheles albimanus TaxID=7167 RepID=A0A182F7T0_ANOAL
MTMDSQSELMQQCFQLLKVIHQYLCGDDYRTGCTVEDPEKDAESEASDRIYLNVTPGDSRGETRDSLVAQCEALLAKMEQYAQPSVPLAACEVRVLEQEEEEEEGSYLDMSGSNTPKVNVSSSTCSIDGTREMVFEAEPTNVVEPERLEEHEYELTTDQILYDECQQDLPVEAEEEQLQPLPECPAPPDDGQCPYGGLPASHLRLLHSPKHGTLFKQEKRLFFDQFKKYYVGLVGKWLLVYNSHNDLKPWQTIYIKSIKLDLSLNEHINEKHLFQIYTQSDSKVHFLSPSFQDLNEWIVAIENNLIEGKSTERIEGSSTGSSPGVASLRKLPLPPYPGQCNGAVDETDLPITCHEDGIYEEPALCLKIEQQSASPKEKSHGYDTPKPGTPKPVEPAASIASPCKPEAATKNPSPECKVSPAPAASCKPVKTGWLKNKFNRSPSESVEGQKPSKKSMKKLSFDELPLPDPDVTDAKSPTTKQQPNPKFTLTTTPANKGAKINMIISQLEANGQLNLLSKRLNESSKRYTWAVEDVTG